MWSTRQFLYSHPNKDFILHVLVSCYLSRKNISCSLLLTLTDASDQHVWERPKRSISAELDESEFLLVEEKSGLWFSRMWLVSVEIAYRYWYSRLIKSCHTYHFKAKLIKDYELIKKAFRRSWNFQDFTVPFCKKINLHFFGGEMKPNHNTQWRNAKPFLNLIIQPIFQGFTHCFSWMSPELWYLATFRANKYCNH